MKKALIIASFFLITTLSTAQSLLVGVNLSPNVTLPINNLNSKFWLFPQDSNVTYSGIKAKKHPGFGFSGGPNIVYEGKIKNKVQFIFEGIAAYRFIQYKIDWNAVYQAGTSTGNTYISYAIKRHELGFSLLPGIKYKGWIFQSGLNFWFMLRNTTSIKFRRGNTDYVDETVENAESVKDQVAQRINISLPFTIAYDFSIGSLISIQPCIAYDFGFFDIDGFQFGYTNRREFVFLSHLRVGVKLNIKIKKNK